MVKIIEFIQDELWYGGAVDMGDKFPLCADDEYFLDTTINKTTNQLNPVFISNKGRYIWLERGGSFCVKNGVITVDAPEIEFKQAGTTLRDAATAASISHYPPTNTMPNKRAFERPQYCSWVVHLWSQNQERLLEYARSIVAAGYKPGLLIIDDTWQKDYGVWEFNATNFPNPKAMMKELKELGFTVSMWICPYVSPDSPKSAEYAPWIFDHIREGRIVTDGKRPRFVGWWEGYSAALDFTRPAAKQWINDNVKRLQVDYGVDGFIKQRADLGQIRRFIRSQLQRQGLLHSVAVHHRLHPLYTKRSPSQAQPTRQGQRSPQLEGMPLWAHRRFLKPDRDSAGSVEVRNPTLLSPRGPQHRDICGENRPLLQQVCIPFLTPQGGEARMKA